MNFLYSSLILHTSSLKKLAVDGRRNNQCDANDHGPDDNRERGVLIVLNLFLYREWCNQNDNQKGQSKYHQADSYKYDCRFNYPPKLVQLNGQPQDRGDR